LASWQAAESGILTAQKWVLYVPNETPSGCIRFLKKKKPICPSDALLQEQTQNQIQEEQKQRLPAR